MNIQIETLYLVSDCHHQD